MCTSTTGATATPTTVVDKVSTDVNDPTKVSTALDVFKADISTASTSIDPATGTSLAAQFAVVILAVINPTKNTDGSLRLTAVVTFIPVTDAVTTLTDDHKRVYCPIIKKLLASVAGFQEVDLNDCTWSAQTSVKRQTSPAGSQTQAVSSDVNSNAVSSLQSSAHQQTVSFFVVVALVIISLFLF
jgi:hypothetical protein